MLKEVRLGKVANSPNYIKIAEDSDNQNLLIVGRSGSGKTYALKKIEENLAQSGGAVLVLNYHDTHSELLGNDNIYWLDAVADGIPLSLLSPITHPDGSKEDDISVISAAMDIFCNVCNLKSRQRSALREAMKRTQYRNDVHNTIWAIGDELCKAHDEVADSVYEKFYDIFTQVKVGVKISLMKKGKVTVIDLSKYSEQAQSAVAEMILSFLWRYFRIWGLFSNTVLAVVCDEFQALTIRSNSIFKKILREGRKYHIALFLATQTLADLDRQDKTLLLQAGTQLYFHPSPREAKEIADTLNQDKDAGFQELLLSLRKGECIAFGRFKVGNAIIERPLKMTF